LKNRILAILFSVFLVLAGLEIGLIAFGPFKRAGKSPDHLLWEADQEIGFVPAPNLDIVAYTNEWKNHVRTNEFGFRVSEGRHFSTDGASNSMLFLGDSQTMGVQVPVDCTYVALIEKELSARGRRLRTINAGCNGFNTVQEYLFFKKIYQQGLRPKWVVLYVTNNDLFEDVPGLPYGKFRVDQESYLTGLQPDPVALDRLQKAKRKPAREPNFWLRSSALLRHLRYAYRLWQNPYDMVNWVNKTYLRDDSDPLAQQRWKTATAALRSLNRLVTEYGGRLFIAVHPDPVEWSDEYYRKLINLAPELEDRVDRARLQKGYRRMAEEIGLGFIDMLRNFPAVSVREFRFAMDPHANKSGHRIIATQLLQGLEEMGVLE
jgi:lysophospholipase L1-like esterase